MSEVAGKTVGAAAPPAPPNPPKNTTDQAAGAARPPAAVSKSEYRRKIIFSAMAAGIGFMAGVGVYSELHERSIEFVLIALFMGLGAYVLEEPLWALFDHAPKRSADGSIERQAVAAVWLAGIGIILKCAWDHSIDAAVSQSQDELAGVVSLGNDGLFRAFGALIIVGLAAMLMMHVWMWRAKSMPPHARWWGLGLGAFLGLTVCLIGTGVEGEFAAKRGLTAAAYLYKSGVDPRWLWAVDGIVFFWFVGLGLAGGFAVDRTTKRPVTGDLLRAVGLFSACYIVSFLFLSHTWKLWYGKVKFPFMRYNKTFEISASEFIESWAWLPVAAMLSQVAVWLITVDRDRDLWDFLLGSGQQAPESGSGTHAAALGATTRERESPSSLNGAAVMPPPETAPSGPSGTDGSTKATVIPFRPREGGPSTEMAPEGAASGTKGFWYSLVHPTGDRLIAMVALVIAFAAMVVAYHLGTLRGDPLILINIAENFQKDSGLSDKALRVHSDGRVITLRGRVDSEAEHQKAVQEVLAVRGVKQIIDQIQVAPPTPPLAPAPVAMPPIIVVPAQPQQPALNTAVSIQRSGSSRAAVQKTAKPQQQPQKRRFLSNLKDNAQNTVQKTSPQNSPGAKSTMQPQASDEQKHKGFFHFLKKDKKDKKDKNKSGTRQ